VIKGTSLCEEEVELTLLLSLHMGGRSEKDKKTLKKFPPSQNQKSVKERAPKLIPGGDDSLVSE